MFQFSADRTITPPVLTQYSVHIRAVDVTAVAGYASPPWHRVRKNNPRLHLTVTRPCARGDIRGAARLESASRPLDSVRGGDGRPGPAGSAQVTDRDAWSETGLRT